MVHYTTNLWTTSTGVLSIRRDSFSPRRRLIVDDRKQLKRLIDVAAGRSPADLRIANCRIVDVFNKEIFEGDVLVSDGRIAGFGKEGFPEAERTVDAHERYLVPGFIDSHVHIESSHCSPGEFARLVVPCGTTTVIADPHEICNVCGIDGLDYMLDASEGLPLQVFMMIPSCVPATPFENAGATMLADSIETRIDHPRVLGLGELMDYFGVVNADDAILDKLMVTRAAGKSVDGHSPAITGSDLDAYSASGVRTDHECDTPEELHERIRRGMYVLLRQGSACRNVLNLLGGVTGGNERRCLFCTDDRQPKSIIEEGHIDNNIRLAVGGGLDPLSAIRIATINSAECFGLRDRGAIAPGYRADFSLVDDLEKFHMHQVFIGGELIAQEGKYLFENPHVEPKNVSGRMQVADFSADRLRLPLKSSHVHTIDIIPGGVVTSLGDAIVSRSPQGDWMHDPMQDVVKLAVVERHHGTGNVGVALIRNYGIKGGAIAMSIAHDSHNIIVVGDNDTDMVCAVEELIRLGGGVTMVKSGKVLDSLPLPIAGLMTDETGVYVNKMLNSMHKVALEELHVNPDVDPFMTLCFMALPVIPAVKLTDVGLFDVTRFKFIPIEIE